MRVIKTQLANGKFQYTAQHNGVETVLVKSSTKDFVEMSVKEFNAPNTKYEGVVIKFQSSTKEVNNLRDFVFQCKTLSQHKNHNFYICKVETIEEVKEEEEIVVSTKKVKFSKIGSSFVKQWFDNDKNCFQYEFFKSEIDFLNAQNK